MKPPSTTELTDFTLASYSKILKYLRQFYSIIPVCNSPWQNNRYLILRHDVDFSLPASLKFAQLEHDLGIKSTFFFLFSSPFYNLHEQSNTDIVKQVSNLGHEIGLHYHPQYYYSNKRNCSEILRNEMRILEQISGKKIRSIARHGPLDRDPFATFKGYINTNNPLIRGDLFVHDSCRAWTPFEGLIKILKAPVKKAQLLTHPENWQEDKVTREDLISRLVQNAKGDQIVLKQKLKEAWLKDPLVLKYDNITRNKNLMRYYDNAYKPAKILASNTIINRLKNYQRIIAWHLINTQPGWLYYKTKNRLRDKLKT